MLVYIIIIIDCRVCYSKEEPVYCKTMFSVGLTDLQSELLFSLHSSRRLHSIIRYPLYIHHHVYIPIVDLTVANIIMHVYLYFHASNHIICVAQFTK